MENGWIKLHRKLLDNPISKSPELAWCWVRFLLEASHKDYEFFMDKQKVCIKPGQFIWGAKEWGIKLNVSTSTARRIMICLKNEQLIELQPTTKYTLITVKKWKEYQETEQQSEQRLNNERTTTEQRLNTNKNVKNIKNDKKDTAASAADSKKDDETQMDYKGFVEWSAKSQQRAVKLIGEWADTIKPSFQTKGQWRVFIKRNLRPANDLAKFTDEQIAKAFSEIQKSKDWLKKPTLETIIKFLN